MRDYRIHFLVLLAISLGCASGTVALAQNSPLQVTGGAKTLHDGLSPDKTSNLLNHPTLAGNTIV